ncbi:hypothetical protein D3C72_1769920 [compost metagenome]
MADQDGGTILAVEHALGGPHVIGKRGQRVLHDRYTIAERGQLVVDRAPARAIGKGAMDQDDVLHPAGIASVGIGGLCGRVEAGRQSGGEHGGNELGHVCYPR